MPESCADAVIDLQSVSKIYRVQEPPRGPLEFARTLFRPPTRTVYALREVSLQVNAGEIVGYIGPNGAGKSTTIKLVAGVMRPTAGEVRVAGRDPTVERHKHLLALGVVFGQRPKLLWDLPVADSFNYHGLVYRVPKSVLNARIAALSERFAIGGLLTQPVRQLSLGQRMRCELALNLLHHPRVLLLDEPTIGLDLAAKAAMREAVRAAATDLGTTVPLTSHDLADVEALAERLVVLNEGRIIFAGTLAALYGAFALYPTLHLRTSLGAVEVRAHLEKQAGVRLVYQQGAEVVVAYDPAQVRVAALIGSVMTRGAVQDVALREPRIEDVVAAVYARGEDASVSG